MAVEKLELLNLVARIGEMDQFLRRLALMENIHLVNAMTEVDQSRFTLAADDDYSQQLIDMCMVKAYRNDAPLREVADKLSFIMRTCRIKPTVDKQVAMRPYDFSDSVKAVDEIYRVFKANHDERIDLEEERDILSQLNFVRYLEDMQLDLKRLKEMKNFTLRIGSISKESRERLSKNYENITATIMHIGEVQGEEVILVVYPEKLSLENERLLKSVFFREISLIEKYLDYPDKMRELIDERLTVLNEELERVHLAYEEAYSKYVDDIKDSYSKLIIEKTVVHMKSMIAVTRGFFYMAGWIPSEEKQKVEAALEGMSYEVVTVYKAAEEASTNNIPPTRLHNNGFFKPFEVLVNLYGVPSYFEMDPTAVIGIMYMLFFGAMFGDLGQGMVIFAAGAWLAKKSGMALQGGLLKRIGFSSMVFGTLYDSFFGFEEVISHFLVSLTGNEDMHAVFIRPLENTNLMLGASIVFGVFLLIFAFGISVYNKMCHKNYQEAFFGRNGVAGLILYVSGIGLGLTATGMLENVSSLPFVLAVLSSAACILFREPLYNIIRQHKPLHHEPPVDYYVENGFELLDTFIGFTSNTLSFVRIGAFALNHVGLFIAFHTLADMIGGTTGMVLMTVVGNIMVIGLEGLVVFIQGLRLSYYELFGKFFVGDGLPFSNIEIKNYDVR